MCSCTHVNPDSQTVVVNNIVILNGPQAEKQKHLCKLRHIILFSIYRLRRPIGRLTVAEQRLEGEFRYVNSRLITNRCVICSITSVCNLFLEFLTNLSIYSGSR